MAVELGSDTVTMHDDGTYTIEWCGQKIERIQPWDFEQLAKTCAAVVDGDYEVMDLENLKSEVTE